MRWMVMFVSSSLVNAQRRKAPCEPPAREGEPAMRIVTPSYQLAKLADQRGNDERGDDDRAHPQQCGHPSRRLHLLRQVAGGEVYGAETDDRQGRRLGDAAPGHHRYRRLAEEEVHDERNHGEHHYEDVAVAV